MRAVALLLQVLYFLHDAAGTSHFAVYIDGQVVDAREVAREHGFTFVGKLFSDEDIYHFQHSNSSQESRHCLRSCLTSIQNDDRVVLITHQVPRYRDKRRHVPLSVRSAEDCVDTDCGHSKDYQFNDPFYPHQWYLHSTNSSNHNLNVWPVWAMGLTGRGVTLSVLDDGLQHSNADIAPNYEPSVSYDISNLLARDSDPSPNPNSTDNSHGTYCAAIMAAAANNSFCGIGVAYGAKVGGVRLLEGPVTDLQESLALTYRLDKVDVFSASWGPRDDGTHVDGPGPLGMAAFRKGITQGRQGKGVIYVWAVGNGGVNGDNCNLDGYASSMYTLSVNALTEDGLSCFYDEPCSSTLASIYIGGRHNKLSRHREMNVVVPELNGKCRDTFQGTSAAAPMAAGVVALVLQANPNLTWRDVQHLVVLTATKTNADSGWRTNGAGFHYHLVYGFGALDALDMVKNASTWVNVPPRQNVTVNHDKLPRDILAGETTAVEVKAPIHTVSFLEHVVVNITLRHEQRGLLQMTLISPSGTRSEILTWRKNDLQTWGFKNWDFVSVNFWGEDSVGTWTLLIANSCNKTGELLHADFTFYGF